LEKERAQYAKELETYKSELDKLKKEHELKFAIVHEKRAEAIHELYKRIMRIHRMCGVLKNEHQDLSKVVGDKACEDIAKEVIAMNFYFGDNALYFPGHIQKKHGELFTTVISQVLLFIDQIDIVDNIDDKRFTPDVRKQLRDTIFPFLKEKLTGFDSLLIELEAEFKKLLGIESDSSK